MVQDIRAALRIGFDLQKVLRQQHFVDRGRNLGDEDAVIVIHAVLRRIRTIGMHRMAQLMRERERVVERIGVIQKHIGMHAEHAGRERAGGLALVLVNIDPALVKRAAEGLAVFLAHWLRRFQHELLRLFIGHIEINLVDHRNVQVVQVQLVLPQRLSTHFEIALHRAQTTLQRGNEIVVQRNRNVIAVQHRFASALIAAHIGIIAIELHAAGIGRGQGVDVFFEFAEVLFERILAYRGGFAFAIHAKRAVAQRCFVAVLIDHIRERHIDAFEHIKHVSRRAGSIGQHREHLFAIFIEHMRAHTANILDHMAIGLYGIVLHERIQLF